MKNLTAQQKLRVQKEFEHFKDTHGALPTKLSDFKARSFSNAERPYASWLIKQLKKRKNNPSHLEKLDSDIRNLKDKIEGNTKYYNQLMSEGMWWDARNVGKSIIRQKKELEELVREQEIQKRLDESFWDQPFYDDSEWEESSKLKDIRRIQLMIEETIQDINEGLIIPKEGKKRIFLLKKMKKKKNNPRTTKQKQLQIIMDAAIGYINRTYCSFINRFFDVSYEDNINILFVNLDNVVGSRYKPMGISDPDNQLMLQEYYPEFFKEGEKNRIIYFELMREVVKMYKDDMQNLLQVVHGFGISPYEPTREFHIKRILRYNNETIEKIYNYVRTDKYFNNQLNQLQ